MNVAAFEAFLARLYTDDALRSAFLTAPETVARSAGLDDDSVRALLIIDRDGLHLAATSYARKRAVYARKRVERNQFARLWQRFRTVFGQ